MLLLGLEAFGSANVASLDRRFVPDQAESTFGRFAAVRELLRIQRTRREEESPIASSTRATAVSSESNGGKDGRVQESCGRHGPWCGRCEIGVDQ